MLTNKLNLSQPFSRITRVFAFVALLFVSACAGDEAVDTYVEGSVDTLYNQALSHLQSANYKEAVKLFNEVERQHPYSAWATRAQLMAAYGLYMNNEQDEAIVALDRFIQLHPSHKDVAYAYYLKGLSYYEQISDVARDQKMTHLAMSALKAVMTRFPDSKYARDAKVKVDLTYDHLAGKDMEIGRFYLKQKKYLAALKRFQNVVEAYQTTTHVPEALHRMIEAYLALGMMEEARKTGAVLGHNFPGSEWYVDTYTLVEGKTVPNMPASEVDTPWYQFW